jgi:hypothetical protein
MLLIYIYKLWICTNWTVNQIYYLEVLERLCEKVKRTRPELITNFLMDHLLIRHCLRELLATKCVGTPFLFTESSSE